MIKIKIDFAQDFEHQCERYIENLSGESVKDIANIVSEDITENIANARSIYGGNVARSKKKKGKTLIDKGILLKSVYLKKINDGWEVRIKSVRDKIAGYLHYGTSKMIDRPFFGISKNTETKINNYIHKKNNSLEK